MKEVFQLQRPGGKKGTVIPMQDYLVLKDFMVELLQTKKEITLTELFEEASIELYAHFRDSLYFQILNVKQHLESEGLIRIIYRTDHSQIIKPKARRSNIRQQWIH